MFEFISMLITILISIVIAFLLGKLKYKDLKDYVRNYKEKIFYKKGRGTEGADKGAGIGDKDCSAGGDDCQG